MHRPRATPSFGRLRPPDGRPRPAVPHRVLVCLPDTDFDPTEAATPWHRLREAGWRVAFATEHGHVGACDPLVLRGPIFGRFGADPDATERYQRMVQSAEFQQPLAWSAWQPGHVDEYSALLLPGGHAPGMKPYLESDSLRRVVLDFVGTDRLVAAICHGVIVLARTVDSRTGRSVLHERRCTALTRSLELSAWAATFWRLGNYYRTYPTPVETEVTAALAHPRQFERGRAAWLPFVVRDGNLLTARWPKDADLFAAELIHALAQRG